MKVDVEPVNPEEFIVIIVDLPTQKNYPCFQDKRD
jgi:hypothetical protein